jgi:hypothetical protein
VNGKMKNKAIQKFSPFALGMVLCSYQMAQVPMAYGASLNSVAATDDSLLQPNVSGLQPALSAAPGGCALSSAGSGSVNSLAPSLNASTPGSSLSASSSSGVLASAVTGSVVPSSVVANAPATDLAAPSNLSSNLIAQAPALDDCCEIGGTTTCEVAGVAPSGGGALGGFPLASLAGLAVPLVAIPLLAGGGGGGGGTPPPVPEPSSTAAITAGIGLLGLWYGRRFRTSHKPSA